LSKKENKAGKGSVPEKSFEVEVCINKWGDIHFKKAMLQNLQKFSGIKQLDKLSMRFLPGKIEIVKK